MRAPPLLVLALALACAGGARAQMTTREGIQLQNQILELRRDLDALAQRGGGGGGTPYAPPPAYPQTGGDPALAAQLLDRVQTLEGQVRELRGALDERTNQLQRAQEELAKQVGDLAFKLGNGGAAAPPSSPVGGTLTPPSPDAPPGTPPQRTPELALQEGNAALARRDYALAETDAREVLARGRATPRAADAQFLLAQALLGERNFQAAAVAYDDAYNANRRGSRAEDALLGLANALTGMGEKPAACATLEKLRREFPNGRGSVRDAAGTLRGRNGCG